MTGFSPAVRAIATERSGEKCERCARGGCQLQLHHRRPRGMGGSKAPDTNLASNALALCASCHNWVEHNRTAAEELGYLVPQGKSPAEFPVFYYGWVWVLLGDDGSVTPVDKRLRTLQWKTRRVGHRESEWFAEADDRTYHIRDATIWEHSRVKESRHQAVLLIDAAEQSLGHFASGSAAIEACESHYAATQSEKSTT